MDGKTAWDHVLDEPVASPPGERPMKAEMDARFDGSFSQFVEWMNEVFKNPDGLRVRVIIGTVPLREEVIPMEKTYSKAARDLNRVAGHRISLVEAENVVASLYPQGGVMMNKIEAIKVVREKVSGFGLKEAKDFVESLPDRPPRISSPSDEIPF
jgi:Ribosomal protein L7/L12 C-terminal domain